MLKGRFERLTAPYIEGQILIPRMELRGKIAFLIDTGADGTVVMPRDSMMLGIDFGSLSQSTTSIGIGGMAQGFDEQAILSFNDGRYIFAYLLQIQIPTPTEFNQRFPSLLGRDILNQGRFVMDAHRDQVCFTPRTWDLRQRI